MYENERTARVGVERRSKKKHLDRLTRDVLAAEKAGQSYGKWKADHPHTPDEDDEEEDQTPGPAAEVCNCKNCGQPFARSKNKTNKLYCSTRCQLQYNNRKRQAAQRRANPGQPTACRVCGTVFLADYQHRIYCGKECYRKGQLEREAERRRKKKLEEMKK